MSASLHTLKRDHRIIERALRALNGVCLRLEWGDPIPADVLDRLVDFISVFADRYHHGKEEAILFPALEQHGITREGGPLGAISEQHDLERELTDGMRRAAAAYREIDPEARRQFVEAARRYVDHLTTHIEEEDAILFRVAGELLDPEELVAIGEAFKEAESKLEPKTFEAYERLSVDLEHNWSV
jgi:hemerythrin-like domain-containing protein